MKFLNHSLFCLIVFCNSVVFSQDDLSSIQFKLIDYSNNGISDEVYTLFHGNDSITTFTTDENGEFNVEIRLEFNSEYAIKPINNPNGSGSSTMEFQTATYPMDYVFEALETSVRRELFSGQVAYYQPKEVKKIEEFEVEQVLSIIDKHPQICIQFSQTIIHSESRKIANKRKANFLKFLNENGVDMSCIQFEEEPRFLRAFDEDQRSRIQGAIYSLESKCNQ